MRLEKNFLPALILAVAAGAACSSESSNGNAANPNTARSNGPGKNGNVAINAANQQTANINAVTPTIVDTNSNRPTNQLRESTLIAQPAPDNSTFTSTMDKDGTFMEVREFKSDPLIAKVVRKIYVDKSKYFVHLKSGKVVEAPADKMNNFRGLAPANILEAIGLNRPAAPANVTREMKMKEQ